MQTVTFSIAIASCLISDEKCCDPQSRTHDLSN